MSDYYGGDPRGPGFPPPTGGRSQRAIFVALSLVIVAGLVVIVLAVTGVFSGGGTPTAGRSTSSQSTPPGSSTPPASTSSARGTPTDEAGQSDEIGPSAGDGTDIDLCASRDDPASTARTFVSYLALNLTESASECVYAGRLGDTELKALSGVLWSPASIEGGEPTYTFTPATGSGTITVTVELHDGRYYVIAATRS